MGDHNSLVSLYLKDMTINKNNLLFTVLAAIITTLQFNAWALPTGTFATSSRLATGKWVKVSIPENGMYQITYKELLEMGFSNPESVRIYGHGGHPISETLDGKALDDLVAVPFKHFGEKICFYGNGPVKFTISNPATPTPRYTREMNSYSRAGYYFITSDDGTPAVEPSTVGISNSNGGNMRATSINYFHHEQELSSPSQSGKTFLGESLHDGSITIPYNLPNLCGDSTITVNTCAAAKGTKYSYITAQLNDISLSFTPANSRITSANSEYVFYNSASPYTSFKPQLGASIPSSGTITVNITCPDGTTSLTMLDYITLTYYNINNVNGTPHNQIMMGINQQLSNDRIVLPDASGSIQVWNIDNPQKPKNMLINSKDGELGFYPAFSGNWVQYIAFNPDKELMSIGDYEEVENQNIHAMPVPDMVIVTCKELMEEAERIAQLHRDNDQMTVHVLDQQKIFNEFSSGTPDAMAIRLMNKMFYDRDNSKFKYVLMFGAGSYDNRQISGKRDCTIITFESTASNDEYNSYVNDDFFGMLEDNSGKTLASDMLLLGVGRIPCATLSEARSDVDKLINYVKNPDYGPWRNNNLYIGDYYAADNNIHIFQAEGISNIINDELGAGMASNKVYMTQYPIDSSTGFALEAKRELNSQLKSGQFFMTYVGHAGPIAITKTNMLWTTNDAKTIENPHHPIVTTACCDVARYDSNQRGIMEAMFHNKNGGAIAMVASTRSAYADGNDALNQAFVRALFSFNTTGEMPTLGGAYKQCKQAFGRTINYNKMMFVLLGDPAMKINYPKPYFKITKVNGKNVTNGMVVATRPLQEVTVEATVMQPDGVTKNTNFNGNATLTIYDMLRKQTTENNRDIYFPRNMLVSVNGRVENGVFTATAMIPRYILSTGSYGEIKVYAHNEGTDQMVNGSYTNLKLGQYIADDPLNTHDVTSPVINEIYINDKESYAAGAAILNNCTLHINATDDYSFSNPTQAIGNSMTLNLDGGKQSFPFVKDYATMTNNGKTLTVAFPMQLEEGPHTLDYTVYDVAGNSATRSLTFVVGGKSQASIMVEEKLATEQATFHLDSPFYNPTTVDLKVLDISGNVVWTTTTSSFPYTWNLTNRKGRRVAPGVYKVYGKYQTSDGAYGGTNIEHIIVAEPHKKGN